MNEGTHCCAEDGKKRPWYLSGLFLISGLTLALFGTSFFFPAMEEFRRIFLDYVRIMFWPVLAGFFAGGLIDHYVPKEYISKHLSIPKKRTIFYSVGLGFLMSACCHGILAISM
ncbi:MAG: hypothetical protein WC484_05825, partial [Candidatus Omnitrophota bacterium]